MQPNGFRSLDGHLLFTFGFIPAYQVFVAGKTRVVIMGLNLSSNFKDLTSGRMIDSLRSDMASIYLASVDSPLGSRFLNNVSLSVNLDSTVMF